jgi:hypothetical protein
MVEQEKHMIAVCDILGFSNMVETKALSEIVNEAVGWVRRALHFCLHHPPTMAHAVPTLAEIGDHPAIGVTWFSDTILLFTRRDDDACIQQLLSTVSGLLFVTMYANQRIRAGVAFGETHIDPTEHIYVGKPLVEAYRLEQAQEWSGAALTDSAVKRARAANAGFWLTEYAVPCKPRATARSNVAVNWTRGDHRAPPIAWSETSNKPTAEDWERRPDICTKFLNTLAYHDAVCEWCGELSMSDGPSVVHSP